MGEVEGRMFVRLEQVAATLGLALLKMTLAPCGAFGIIFSLRGYDARLRSRKSEVISQIDLILMNGKGK
jgi:hypothetical protein